MASAFWSRARRVAVAFALACAALVSTSLGPISLVSRARAAGPADGSPAAAEQARVAPHDSVVRVVSRAVRDAPSVETLGALRSGSGVVIGERLVLTIGYLVLEAEEVEIATVSGRRVPASVAGYDHATGFAVLRTAVPLGLPALALGDADALAERQRVSTIGYGESVPTELVVLSRRRFVGAWEYLLERPIYTFPPVNNWSGSALIDPSGALVGIGSMILRDAGGPGIPGNLFVPVDLLKPILPDLLAHGRRAAPAQPWLGMSTEMVRGHLMVTRVVPAGPAERAGISTGDIVLAVGEHRFDDQEQFYRLVWGAGPAGARVTLKVLQGGDLKDLTIRSVDRSDALARPSGV